MENNTLLLAYAEDEGCDLQIWDMVTK